MKSLVRVLIFATLAGLSSCGASAGETVSPNGLIRVRAGIAPAADGGYGPATFTVEYGEGAAAREIFVDAGLGLRTQTHDLAGELRLVSVSKPVRVEEQYTMITGKRSLCSNRADERTYRFENRDGVALDVIFRAYDDGVAFRYRFDAGTGDSITREETLYPIADGRKRWMQRYAIDYEGFFPGATDGSGAERGRFPHLWGYPALVEPAEGAFVLITESDIGRGQSASRLDNGDDTSIYRVALADEKLAVSGQWQSPWRVLIVGTLADVVESTLVTDLAEPSKVADTSWIQPGPAAWIYWAHNHGSRDFAIVKEYIDLAAEMGWPYDLIDWEWDVMENGGTIDDALAYAHSKGIKPLLWYNSGTSWIGPGAPGPLDRLNSRENRLKEYAWLQQKGVAGIKIDFFAVDGARMIGYYIDLLEDAAPHRIMINFHGATIPRGWQRTYPHLMTTEAVYGAEWYNNNRRLTEPAASHNATLPFTRNVVGSMDYTPGTFSDSQNPHITTHGHELALPVLFESALQHMPDRPSVYRELPAPVKELLAGMPTAWDDTRLLAGYPGRDVVLARRKGDVWWIAGVNGTGEASTLSFTPDFATVGSTITVIGDGENDRTLSVGTPATIADPAAAIEVPCLPRGGFVAVIRP
ncbi:MAG: glycoside hydrolase family 97 protein [Alistipes sp.]|jgi:hypothetical protein|nr:glycoside hydrolase family 97 protein [Alistipes sp.]